LDGSRDLLSLRGPGTVAPGLAIYRPKEQTLTGNGEPERIRLRA
jgi:hypothetical protein